MEPITAHRQRNAVSTPAPDEIRITRVFNAPLQQVWNAWTNPVTLVHWFGCAAFSTTHAEADVRVGGRWRVTMVAPTGEEFPAYGTYLEVHAPGRLSFTHQWEKLVGGVNPAHHRTEVTVEFFDVEGCTRMEFRQTGLATPASRDSHIGGWSDSFNALHRQLQP
ncbi:MAG: SRPBCC domain-containing protein [Flavobacteriales bacterium]|nr:SRPBCC domain-containing protein [Flavobacteriales bacterium]